MEKFTLRKNADVTIRSLSTKDQVYEIRGKLEGYTMLQQSSALIIRLAEKKKGEDNVCLIPEHMVLSIQVHKNGRRQPKTKKTSNNAQYA